MSHSLSELRPTTPTSSFALMVLTTPYFAPGPIKHDVSLPELPGTGVGITVTDEVGVSVDVEVADGVSVSVGVGVIVGGFIRSGVAVLRGGEYQQ